MNKEHSIKIFDGYVKLIDSMGDDNTPLKAARMSTNNPTGIDIQKDDNLRDRLLYDLHTTPFQGMLVTVEMELPLFCLRQLERHRTLSGCCIEVIEIDEDWRKFHNRNEYSGRYSQMENKYYVPEAGRIQKQSKTNKQGGVDGFTNFAQTAIRDSIKSFIEYARDTYDSYITSNLSNELARIILPGAQYIRVQYTADVLNWARFLALRVKKDVQPETVAYAKAIEAIIRELFPKTYEGLADHIIYAEKLSQSEFMVIRELVTQDINTFRLVGDDLLEEKFITKRQFDRLCKKLGVEDEI